MFLLQNTTRTLNLKLLPKIVLVIRCVYFPPLNTPIHIQNLLYPILSLSLLPILIPSQFLSHIYIPIPFPPSYPYSLSQLTIFKFKFKFLEDKNKKLKIVLVININIKTMGEEQMHIINSHFKLLPKIVLVIGCVPFPH